MQGFVDHVTTVPAADATKFLFLYRVLSPITPCSLPPEKLLTLLLLLLSSTLSQVLKSLSKKNLINQTYRYITRYRYGTLPMFILRPPVVNKLSMVQNRPIYGWVWFWTKHFYTSCYTQIHKQRGYRNV